MTQKEIELYIKKISEETGLLKEEIMEKASKKKKELEGLIGDKGALELLGKDYGINMSQTKNNKIKKGGKEMGLEDFFGELDVSTEEFPDFLKVRNGITFTLKLADVTKKPRKYTDSYGNEKWAWDVLLLSVEPEEAKDQYITNKMYSFSLGKRAMRRFKEFWISNDNQYDKKFTFERVGKGYQTDYVFELK